MELQVTMFEVIADLREGARIRLEGCVRSGVVIHEISAQPVEAPERPVRALAELWPERLFPLLIPERPEIHRALVDPEAEVRVYEEAGLVEERVEDAKGHLQLFCGEAIRRVVVRVEEEHVAVGVMRRLRRDRLVEQEARGHELLLHLVVEALVSWTFVDRCDDRRGREDVGGGDCCGREGVHRIQEETPAKTPASIGDLFFRVTEREVLEVDGSAEGTGLEVRFDLLLDADERIPRLPIELAPKRLFEIRVRMSEEECSMPWIIEHAGVVEAPVAAIPDSHTRFGIERHRPLPILERLDEAADAAQC